MKNETHPVAAYTTLLMEPYCLYYINYPEDMMSNVDRFMSNEVIF